MKKTKIVFIGAGSMSFGIPMFRDLFSSKELNGSTLSLVDIDEENLDRMYELAVKMNEVSGIGLKIEKTKERREVLPGAEFVVNSLAIERCELWKKDFQIPQKYGIKHCLGENGGPGALFFSLRTIPLIMDIVRDMEELCPNAFFLNFSNPESRVILALNKYTSIRCVGLCHGVFMGRGEVAHIMGRDSETVDVLAAGLNHFQWLLEVKDKATGEDLTAELREKEKTFDKNFAPLSRKMYNHFGFYPSCSDDHIGEYVAYGWEGGEHGYNFEWDEKARVEMKKEIRERIDGIRPIEEWLTPSGEKAVEVITSIMYNKKTVIESGIVYNKGAITNLPEDAAVEVPIMVDANGIHPITVGELPYGIARLCAVQVGVQQLAVEAAVNGSKELAMQALLVDPVINSITAAEKLLEELWEINKPYIKKCI